jgi:hypothetical protein
MNDEVNDPWNTPNATVNIPATQGTGNYRMRTDQQSP